MFGSARRRAYDVARFKNVVVTKGVENSFVDFAVIMIFQPNGLQGSLFETLRHFRAKGVAAIVVANHSLKSSDLERLQTEAHLIIQRPNYGYDFGGYREGVLTLLKTGVEIRNLFVLNDSIWFPLRPDCTLVDQALASNADLFGVSYNDRPGHRPLGHIQSYFYRFGRNVVHSADFRDYWRNLFMTDNKGLVIRQCEMKLTNHFKNLGYTTDYLFGLEALRGAIKALNDDEFVTAVRYHAQVETSHGRVLLQLIDERPDDWRQRLEEMVDARQFGKYFLIAHPDVLLTKLRSPVLKKDVQRIYQVQRSEMLKMGLEKTLIPAVREEILQRDNRFSAAG